MINQSEPFVDVNVFDSDAALQEAIAREGGSWGVDRLRDFGQVAGSAEADEHRRRAQRNGPQLHQHDRFGHRVDEVEYDPSMHWCCGSASSARSTRSPGATRGRAPTSCATASST